MSATNGAVFRDGRVDKVVSWAVGALLVAVVTWMVAELRSLRSEVTDLRVTVVQVANNRERIERLERQIEALRQRRE